MVRQQPQPVRQENPEVILDEDFANNRVAKMRKMGATNAAPPLAPSTHLKNKVTGIIFPWTAALAEQRDILVNCDEFGNTDPAAWKNTMLTDEQVAEQSDLSKIAAYTGVSHISKEAPVTPAVAEDAHLSGQSEDVLHLLDKAME